MPAELTMLAERYALEDAIARGGMGVVWRAQDHVLARTVAVKVLHPHLSDDESFLQRFRVEAMAAARLTHPNIVAIYDTGIEADPAGGPDHHFIVMEYCPGGTLADLVTAEGPLDAERVIAIGYAIGDALGYAHQHGIVHRDIKPANVLIGGEGSLKVADFGIAKAAFAAGDITTTGTLIGSVTYISPEQARGEEPDARSDIYSLGVVLYELLVGRPPFQEETQVATAMRHVNDVPPSPRSIRAGIPRELDAVICKALAKDPSRRFQSAHELHAALKRGRVAAPTTRVMPSPVHRQPPAPPAPPTTPRSALDSSDTRWLIRVIALIALAVGIALALSALIGGDEPGRSPADNGRQQGVPGIGGIAIESVADFDPYGDGEEHAEDAPLAGDGNESTAWETESYRDSFALVGKRGVGLVFDLSSAVDVSGVELRSVLPGYSVELRAADSPGQDENDFELIAQKSSVGADETLTFETRAARYWLVWITDLPGGGAGRAEINEVTFFEP